MDRRHRPPHWTAFLFAAGCLTVMSASAQGMPTGGPRAALVQVIAPALPSQLVGRLKPAIVVAMKGAGVEARDLTAASPALSRYLDRHARDALATTLGVPYIAFVDVSLDGAGVGLGAASYRFSVEVRDGATARWLGSTAGICPDCSDSEIVESVGVAASALLKAALTDARGTPEPVSKKDRADRGARLMRLAAAAATAGSWGEDVRLTKEAFRAGAGGAAAVKLAELFFDRGEIDLLADYAQKAIESGVTGDLAVRAYRMSGLAHWYYAQWAQSVRAFETMLKLDPKVTDIADKLEFARVARDRPRDLVDQLEERWRLLGSLRVAGSDLGQIAVRAGGGNRAYLLLGRTSFERHRFAEALAYYEKVIASEPTNAAAKEGRHRSLQELTAQR